MNAKTQDNDPSVIQKKDLTARVFQNLELSENMACFSSIGESSTLHMLINFN